MMMTCLTDAMAITSTMLMTMFMITKTPRADTQSESKGILAFCVGLKGPKKLALNRYPKP